MPVTTAILLQLTDGTTTCDLAGNTDYALTAGGWIPVVAPRRRSTLGGLRYADVDEEIVVNVYGSDAADAMANLATLSRLLDQAERWYAGENVDPVTIKYQPQGSTLANPSAALVLGRAGDMGIGLPSFDLAGILNSIDGVALRFRRRGQWLQPEEAAAGAGSTLSIPLEGSKSFGTSHPGSSPLNVRLGGFTATTTPAIPPSYLLVYTDTDRQYVLASDAATNTDFTTYSGGATGAHPVGGSVLRYTPAGTTAKPTGVMGISSAFTDEARIVGVFAFLRTTSLTTIWTVSATLSGKGISVSTPDTILTPDDLGVVPKVIFLGTVVSDRSTFETLILTVTASAASGVLDIDTVVIFAMDDEYSRVLALDAMDLTGAFASGATAVELTISARALRNRVPFVGMYAPSTDEYVQASYRGDARLSVTGDTVYVSWLAVGGGSGDDSWVYQDASNNAVVAQAVNVARYAARLSPE